jgi:hypothetical protein
MLKQRAAGFGRRAWRRASLVGLVLACVVVSGCTSGLWTVDQRDTAPVNAIHAALLPTGKVLLIEGSGNYWLKFEQGSFKTSLWDPLTHTHEDIFTPNDFFCAGHAGMADGRLMVAGGTTAYASSATNDNPAGLREAWIFDPFAEEYVRTTDMSLGRWYPTVVVLGNGDLFTVGGFDEAGIRSEDSEIFNGTAWVDQKPLPPGMVDMPLYPGLHLMKDGRLFFSGTNSFGGVSGPPGIWEIGGNTFSPVTGLPDPTRRDQGTSVLLPPAQDQKVMIMGGGNHFDPNVGETNSTAIIDLDGPAPAYQPGPPLKQGKMYTSAVILPDSTVLQTGGARSISTGDNPINTAQIYNPATNTWTDVASPKVGRGYHSNALLLPDGSVATFGSQPRQEVYEPRIERFYPPYFFKGTARPKITSAPSDVTYGGSYPITTTQASPLRSAVLVRPLATTHQMDANQRLVSLPLSGSGSNRTITMPPTGNDAPPGYYMLFVVDQNGVPSVASWVHLT